MTDEQDNNQRISKANKDLDRRLAKSPRVYQRLHQIADAMDEAIASGLTADEAEGMAIKQVNELGNAMIGDWAQAQEQISAERAQEKDPILTKDSKKKLRWHTTYGIISIDQTLLRIGRRGKRVKPFCQDSGIVPQGCSLRLQQALVDFGAESSFSRAVKRFEQHYQIAISRHKIYENTLKHGREMGGFEAPTASEGAREILTQIDGTMVPITHAGKGKDRRKGKSTGWVEVRLCSARQPGEAEPIYGAGRADCQAIKWIWEATVRQAGWTPATRAYGVGDGARWIADQFDLLFGKQGQYLLDFYHVSGYLAEASKELHSCEKKATKWRRTQQMKLLAGKSKEVIRGLAKRAAECSKESAISKAHQYLNDRKDQLNYDQAQANDRPIGSGEIESGNRHVIQHRLKIPGAWWKEANLQPMLNLRTVRANNQWDNYWKSFSCCPNDSNAPYPFLINARSSWWSLPVRFCTMSAKKLRLSSITPSTNPISIARY